MQRFYIQCQQRGCKVFTDSLVLRWSECLTEGGRGAATDAEPPGNNLHGIIRRKHVALLSMENRAKLQPNQFLQSPSV